MKKILFFLLLTLAARPAFPQEPEHPLTFNGVPMGGPIDEFVSEMEKRGLKLSDWNLEHADWSSDMLIYMFGDFAGFSCNLTISSMFGKTWLILVSFPEYKSWEPLQIIYEGLQKKTDRQIRRTGRGRRGVPDRPAARNGQHADGSPARRPMPLFHTLRFRPAEHRIVNKQLQGRQCICELHIASLSDVNSRNWVHKRSRNRHDSRSGEFRPKQ